MPRPCDHPGCGENGDYRAPKKRHPGPGPKDPDAYYWFCLEHVRDFNKSWNYFAGMSRAEIERFQQEVATWHRPTWKLGQGPVRAAMDDNVHDPFDLWRETGGQAPGNDRAPPPERGRRLDALAALDLEPDADLEQIKRRFKQLAKKYHPDVNGGSKQASERFKVITEAYKSLLEIEAGTT